VFIFWFRALRFLVFLFFVPALPTFPAFLTYPSVFITLTPVPKSPLCKVVVHVEAYPRFPIASVFRIISRDQKQP